MTVNKRWKTAQHYEKEWWITRKNRVDFDFYKDYAEELIRQIRGIVEIKPASSILEIGSGAGGIITYLSSADRHAVDPLEDFFSSIPRFKSQRDPSVNYQTAKAENLPYENNQFDFIICDNVLDHCDDINKVFIEMRRVLKPGGVIYIRLNIYTFWGKIIRRIVEVLGIDPGHPHSFIHASIRKYFNKHGIELIRIEENGFLNTWIKEIKSGKFKEILKALTFSTPNKTLFLLKKTI